MRCYRRTDSAFSLVEEFQVGTLNVLSEEFAFEADGISAMKPNGDIVHDTVLAWAKRTLGTPADGPNDVVPATEPEPELETTNTVPLRATPPVPAVEAPAVESVVSEAAAVAEAVSTVPAAAGGTGTLAMSPVKSRSTLTSDAWDEIADLAERATTDATENPDK
ncbi:MAG: hypothetical protein ACJAYU_002257 [Bradymonadia bacterium]